MRRSSAMRRIHWSALMVIRHSKRAAMESWPFAVRPLTPSLGAEISGIALEADMDEPLFRALYRAFLRFQVLLFPPQELPPARQVALARRFGEVQVHVMN